MSEKSDWEQGYDQAQRRFYEERKILTARIAKLEAEATKCHELQDSYCDRIAELEYQLEDWTNNGWAEDYKARIAELEAAQRWIPVSERLPEVNEDVFTLVYDTNDGSTSVSALKHHGDGVWFIWDKGYYVVTHWMPMPKLPEAQE